MMLMCKLSATRIDGSWGSRTGRDSLTLGGMIQCGRVRASIVQCRCLSWMVWCGVFGVGFDGCRAAGTRSELGRVRSTQLLLTTDVLGAWWSRGVEDRGASRIVERRHLADDALCAVELLAQRAQRPRHGVGATQLGDLGLLGIR